MTPDQLKASILQLAIQGKLVPQRPEEGTAEDLYQQIQREKKKLTAAGKLKKEKPLPPITEEEIPFDIPESWKWVRLGDVGILKGGYTFKSGDYTASGIQVVRISDLDGNSITDTNAVYVPEKSCYAPFIIVKGSFLICMTGSIGKMAHVTDNRLRYLNQRVGMFIPLNAVEARYIWHFLNWPGNIAEWMKAKTSANGNIKNCHITNLTLPLPPLAEQRRIVQKIEQMLPLVEQYGKAYTALESLNARFPDDMRKSILQYAIQGKLVPQRPEEGTAEELYQQIQKEKKKLIAAGKLKKEKPLPPISEDEIPFDIPESWKWVRLGDCTTYGQPKQKATPDQVEDDTWCLELEDIEKDSGRILQRLTVGERSIKGDRSVFKRGNVLFSKLRPYLHKILVADADGVCTTELVPFSCYCGILPEYVVLVLKSPCIDGLICSTSYGVKMPRVGTDDMLSVIMPLPPLAEQQRIVNKIEEMMTSCAE